MAQHIQVGDIAPRIQYTGNGTQTAFTYPFPIFNDADLEVYVDSTPELLNTDFTVVGAGLSAGGNITFTAPPASGSLITLRRNIAVQRISDFQQSGVLRAKVLNDELDRLTAEIQQIEEQTTRSLRLKPFDADVNLELPDKATRMDRVLSFDQNGQPVASTTTLAAIEGGAVNAAASAAAAAISETSAATSATNAATSETNAASSATAAAVAAAANLYSAIVNKATSFSVIATDDGHLFVVDTSAASVVVTLPDIVTDVAEGFRVGFMKASALNTLTINRVGTDTVNGGTSYVMTADTEMAMLVADANTPDNWITFGASTTSAGAGLLKSGSTISADFDVVAARDRTENAQTGTAYTLALTDAGDLITMKNAAANTLTVPANATVAFAVGTQIEILMIGTGVTTVTGATGVTINDVLAGSGAIDAQYKGVTLIKKATDTWLMVGAHAVVA